MNTTSVRTQNQKDSAKSSNWIILSYSSYAKLQDAYKVVLQLIAGGVHDVKLKFVLSD